MDFKLTTQAKISIGMHDVCLFMTYDQQVDCFLEDVLKRIDDVEVVKDWIKEVERLYRRSNVHDLITDCLHGETYTLNNKLRVDARDEEGFLLPQNYENTTRPHLVHPLNFF